MLGWGLRGPKSCVRWKFPLDGCGVETPWSKDFLIKDLFDAYDWICVFFLRAADVSGAGGITKSLLPHFWEAFQEKGKNPMGSLGSKCITQRGGGQSFREKC